MPKYYKDAQGNKVAIPDGLGIGVDDDLNANAAEGATVVVSDGGGGGGGGGAATSYDFSALTYNDFQIAPNFTFENITLGAGESRLLQPDDTFLQGVTYAAMAEALGKPPVVEPYRKRAAIPLMSGNPGFETNYDGLHRIRLEVNAFDADPGTTQVSVFGSQDDWMVPARHSPADQYNGKHNSHRDSRLMFIHGVTYNGNPYFGGFGVSLQNFGTTSVTFFGSIYPKPLMTDGGTARPFPA